MNYIPPADENEVRQSRENEARQLRENIIGLIEDCKFLRQECDKTRRQLKQLTESAHSALSTAKRVGRVAPHLAVALARVNETLKAIEQEKP